MTGPQAPSLADQIDALPVAAGSDSPLQDASASAPGSAGVSTPGEHPSGSLSPLIGLADAPADSNDGPVSVPKSWRHKLTPDEAEAWYWTRNPKSAEARLSLLLRRWRVDPVFCAVEAFRTTLLPYQAQALLDLFDCADEVYAFHELNPGHPRRMVLLPSGHGLGKTRVIALAIWIKLITCRFSMILATAPTSEQLTGRLWGELRKLRRRLMNSFPMIAEEWLVQTASITHVNPDFGDWCCSARTARAEKPEGLQGAHALDADDEFGDIAAMFGEERDAAPSGGILVVAEEASGIPDEIRNVLTGAMSEEGAQFIAPGNPTRNDGWFAKDIEKTDRYAVHALDCRMSNRETVYQIRYRDLAGRVRSIRQRGFVKPKYWEDLLADCGGDEEHDRIRVRVRGLVPRSNLEQVIPTSWVDSAFKREPDALTSRQSAVVSLDFGLTGDKHALVVRKGFWLPFLDEWLPPGTPELITLQAVERAKDAVSTFRAKKIVGDANGVGRGAMEVLADYYHNLHPELGVRVIFFNAGKRSTNSRFYRRRDQIWYFNGRRWFSDPRCSIPAGPMGERLKTQICAPSAHEDATKRIWVESKDEVEKRTGEKSGNLADATLMSLVADGEIELDETDEAQPSDEPMIPSVLEAHFNRYRKAQGLYDGSGAIR